METFIFAIKKSFFNSSSVKICAEIYALNYGILYDFSVIILKYKLLDKRRNAKSRKSKGENWKNDVSS